MSIKEQAIKMEQLKQERSETDNATFAEILSVSREIDSISNELFKLGDKRAKLYEKLSELKEKRKRDTAHYDLVIKARQAVQAKYKITNPSGSVFYGCTSCFEEYKVFAQAQGAKFVDDTMPDYEGAN